MTKNLVRMVMFAAATLLGADKASTVEPPIFLPERDLVVQLQAATNPATHSTTYIYGATIGQNWGGSTESPSKFPSRLSPTYEGSNWWEQLDIALPIYLVWKVQEFTPGFPTDPEAINPPQRIDQYMHNPNLPPECPSEPWTQLVASYEYDDYTLYTECAPGMKQEEPLAGSTPIASDGTIRIRDVFGGTGDGTKLILKKVFPPCTPVDGYSLVIVVITWDHPDTYPDAVLGTAIDALPGSVVNIRQDFISQTQNPIYIWMPQLTVMWASADFPGTSPLFTDASDLSRLSAHFGQPVEWGFEGGGLPNFEININPYGVWEDRIESGDLSTFAMHIEQCCSPTQSVCRTPAKAGESDAAAILTWFGVAPTGGSVIGGPSGEMIPEYAIVNPVQNQRAIADPYGYRNIAGSLGEVPWAWVKRLYR